MLSLHSWSTTVVKGCLSATFGTEYSSWCVLCRGMQAGQAASDQYCPRSILVSPPPAWLHSIRTRAIRSFIALAWGGDLVYNVKYCPRDSILVAHCWILTLPRGGMYFPIHLYIHSKSGCPGCLDSAENSNFPQKDCLRTQKLSVSPSLKANNSAMCYKKRSRSFEKPC